jgi:drug/metabolite transporter (DMT)-like permease
MTLSAALGQFVLKHCSTDFTLTFKNLNRPIIYSAVILYFAGPLLYIEALKSMELSKAYSLTALTQLWVLAGSFFLLKEKLSLKNIYGTLILTAGVILWLI